jgi:hypothetical protein
MPRAGLAIGQGRWNSELGVSGGGSGALVEVGGQGHVEEADHHFVVGLFARADGGGGIGVVGILCGIVEPGYGLQLGIGFPESGCAPPGEKMIRQSAI